MFGPKFLIFFMLITPALLACEKADSRSADAELASLSQSLKSQAWETDTSGICETLPKGNQGFLSLQEIKPEHTLTMAFRYEAQETEKQNRIALKSVAIVTTPKQVAWHARLEEEIESWDGVINSTGDSNQIASLTVGQGPELKGPQAAELKVFLRAVETTLGALQTLKSWCGSTEKESTGKSTIELKLSSDRVLKLEFGENKVAHLSDGKARFSVGVAEKGIQWLSESEAPRTIIRLIPIADPNGKAN